MDNVIPMTTTATNNIRIGIDLDGVIYDFMNDFRHFMMTHEKVHPDQLPVPPNTWDFHEEWGMTYRDYLEKMGEAAIKGWIFTSGNVLPGAREGLESLRNAGFQIIIMTARELSTNPLHMNIIARNTEQWLQNNNIPHDELIIANNKTHHNVATLFDDSIYNVESVIRTGRSAFIFDQPWNRQAPYSRVHDWHQVLEECNRIKEAFNLYETQVTE